MLVPTLSEHALGMWEPEGFAYFNNLFIDTRFCQFQNS